MAEGVVPAASRATTAFRSIDELAELCGHYCWVERRIFELTGSRASRPGSGEPGAGDAEVRVALSEMSARHGFFAAQWRDRLPVRAGVDAGALIVAPPGPFGAALDLIESEPDLARVLGGLATQILPRLVERYGRPSGPGVAGQRGTGTGRSGVGRPFDGTRDRARRALAAPPRPGGRTGPLGRGFRRPRSRAVRRRYRQFPRCTGILTRPLQCFCSPCAPKTTQAAP